MVALILATLAAAMFAVFFRIFQLKGIDSMHAIMVNYITAFLFGCLLSLRGLGFVMPFKEDWFPIAVILGVIFVVGMVMLDICTEKAGVAIATVSSRASMVIPIIVSYLVIPDSAKPNWLAIFLLLCALALIILFSAGNSVAVANNVSSRAFVMIVLVVFLTFGTSNSICKLMQNMIEKQYAFLGDPLVDAMNALSTSVVFLSALAVSLLSVLFKPKETRKPFTFKDILGGFGLGTANFFCTYLLIIAMRYVDSSVLFPVHYAGIVALGALIGAIAFKEKLAALQIVGIVGAVGAIVWLCI